MYEPLKIRVEGREFKVTAYFHSKDEQGCIDAANHHCSREGNNDGVLVYDKQNNSVYLADKEDKGVYIPLIIRGESK